MCEDAQVKRVLLIGALRANTAVWGVGEALRDKRLKTWGDAASAPRTAV